MTKKYDYIIIGSGFGGSVSALRLAEKGYKVLVIEKGKWYKAEDFPKTNWNFRKWLWLPMFKFFGIMKMTYYRHMAIISGVGVGGGSLVYANTLPKPKSNFFETGSWAGLQNWENDLNPFYDKALKMLGAEKNPKLFDSDLTLQSIAKDNHAENHFDSTQVAVFFGDGANQTHKDPYFDGKGPERTSCNFCGQCMTGCPNNSKNTLDKNYLHLAQQLGVEIIAEHEVVDVNPSGENQYEVSYKKSTSYFSKTKKVTSTGVVFSGGVLGTVSLLLKLKEKSLPNLSDMVGKDIRSNNEALIAIATPDKQKDFTKGVAIASIYDLDENSHVEPVRYGKGSGFWRALMMPSVNERNLFLRIFKLFYTLFRNPIQWFKIFTVNDFAKQSTVLLFMQNLDSKLQFKKSWFRMSSHIYQGKAPTAFIPEAHEIANKYAEKINGKPMSLFSETITGIPSTAHILGGAVMGADKSTGVIDKHNKVFGYENMYVCDGSMISANPGVNPSLSITAISERAMSFVEEKK
jgi:cholesterol oxidase